jgi:hypothetical protein
MRSLSLWKRLFFALSLFVVFAAPMSVAMTPAAEAGLVPCASSENPQPCTMCHLMKGVQNIFDWGLQIMTYFAVAVIVAMGILYIVSTGDTGMIKMAKEGLKATLYGFTLVLLMYLFVSVILVTLAQNVDYFKAGATSWFDFSCDTTSNVGTSTMAVGQTANTQLQAQQGGALNCTTGKCATKPEVAAAVKSNASGLNPNVLMSIIDAGEGCNKGPSPVGACGYTEVMPQYRRTVCNLVGSDQQTCDAMRNDLSVDINCGAKFLKSDFIPRCGPSIRGISSCYNTGKTTSCGQGSPPYCQRVETYYNSCLSK